MHGPIADLIVAALLSGSAYAAYRVFARSMRAEMRSWMELTRALGLPPKNLRNPRGRLLLAGKLDGYDLKITTEREATLGAPITRFAIEMPDRLPAHLRIVRLEDARTSTRHRVELGDPRIDEQLTISGSAATIFAVFDEPTRLELVAQMASGTSVAHSEVVREINGHRLDVERSSKIARSLIGIGTLLSINPKDLDERLLHNAKTEPCLEVRRNIYSLVLQPGSSSKNSDLIARTGIEDPDPLIKMLSALHLGPEHFDEVERIAREEPLPHDTRLFAFGHLAARAPAEWLNGFIGRVMRTDGQSAQRAVLRSLIAARRTDVPSAVIAAVKENSLTDETLYEVSEALGSLGDETAESTLCRILRATVVPLRLSAIHALARVGTVRSVEPLHQLAKNFLGEPSEVREAAKDAIRVIQGRLADAGAGRLSVIDPHDRRGSVSVALLEPGALSLEEKEP